MPAPARGAAPRDREGRGAGPRAGAGARGPEPSQTRDGPRCAAGLWPHASTRVSCASLVSNVSVSRRHEIAIRKSERKSHGPRQANEPAPDARRRGARRMPNRNARTTQRVAGSGTSYDTLKIQENEESAESRIHNRCGCRFQLIPIASSPRRKSAPRACNYKI